MGEASKPQQPYYIGLDCGTSSVGWAVTDERYNLLTANGKLKKNGKTKTKKKTLWGARLFDEASTAAERRVQRSARRRHERAKTRLKLLRMIFRDEIAKVDPEFYLRLKRSFYYEEDKGLQKNSANTLFNDSAYTDKDFHKAYPTIWHLRQAIMEAPAGQHFDIRLYFLAIQHILKHRGHFLVEGKMPGGKQNFSELFDEFYNRAQEIGYPVRDDVMDEVEQIVKTKGSITDKKKQLAEILFDPDAEVEEDVPKGQKELAGLLVGSSVNLPNIFGLEEAEKYSYSFAKGDFDDKEAEIASAIGLENMDLIVAAKRIYDYGILSNLLGEHNNISAAMVANYVQHEKDLAALKAELKPYPDDYRKVFKTENYGKKFDDKNPSYDAYIGKAYTEDASKRRSSCPVVNQEDFNKFLAKILEAHGVQGELLERAQNGLLLPKQRGQAKGTIPQQLHGNELDVILVHLQADYPSFAKDDNDGVTRAEKIRQIHSFRRPYYCGPLVKRSLDENGNPVEGGKSQFSWLDEEIQELVYPWNFDRLVKKDVLAANFIRRMTNECTYLLGEDVLPKSSLLYQRYMVLNELNNLKVNGRRIDHDLKQRIFERGYLGGELQGNVTLKRLNKWLKDNSLIGPSDEVSGTSEVKTLPKLSTYQDFRRCLGADFAQKYSGEQLEEVVEVITILGNDKGMLERKIQEILGCTEEAAKKLSKLSYKDWGRFSARFLNGITKQVNGAEMTILDALWQTECNLMELLGREVGFGKVVDEFNEQSGHKPKAGAKIKYSDVAKLYCSPAVKRSVWQTVQIVDELVKALGRPPKKIFIEVTRGEDEKAKGKYTTSRRKELETKLKTVKNPEAKELLAELGKREDSELRSKKLFLYFSQMGKCAYSGERINLEDLNNTQLYDIDHIYPRSLTKDDSITRNLVLVKANLNREKTNIYPISDTIRSKMHGTWQAWCRAGLITKEKCERLTRATQLTAEELGGFIARQIVETSQSVKAIRNLLGSAYPSTKIVSVKAGQVSDFRDLMAKDQKDRDGNLTKPGKYEFIKVRELNDFHHAKDAYLNIVVGNVMNETFTDDPYAWVKERKEQKYTIKPERIFRDSREYRRDSDNMLTTWPEVRGWEFADSIQIVSDAMKRNDVLWTRMNYIESGAISDLQLIGRGKADGLLRIKQSSTLDPEKYGGYNSLKGAYFALIECTGRKGEVQRRIVQVPIIEQNNADDFVAKKYDGAKVIFSPIKYKSLIKINGFPMHITGKSSSGLIYYQAIQAIYPMEAVPYIKKIEKIAQKDKLSRGQYVVAPDTDGISAQENVKTKEYFIVKLKALSKMPGLEKKVLEIKEYSPAFDNLDIKTQCLTLHEWIKLYKCNAETADLSSFVPKSSFIGKAGTSEDVIPRYETVRLINQSITGLYEEEIDLKTVQPKPVKTAGKR